METVVISGMLALFGLIFGSFAGAQVWRIRARQLRSEDARLEELQKKRKLSTDEEQERAFLLAEAKERRQERTRLDGVLGKVTEDYSRCLLCQHRLQWYDLLPLVSWLSTGGTCRYCKKPIGLFEPLMEIGVSAAFVVSYVFWPFPLVGVLDSVFFALWLASIVLGTILFAYDVKWFLLPDSVVFPLIGIGALMSAARAGAVDNIFGYGVGVVGAIMALSGLYFALWLVSEGRWVGFGDVKLGFALALLLADWRLALVALFLANLIGTLVVIPGMMTGKLTRKAHVPFGPLLIVGAFIAMLAGESLLAMYLGVVF